MELVKKNLIIDWSKRINGTSTNFLYKWNTPIEIKNNITLDYAQVPNTTYNINNQWITIILMNNNSYTLNLVNGNYSITNLINHIQSLLTANINNCNISYNSNNYKITFTISNNNFKSIIFSDINFTYLLGFINKNKTDENGFNVYIWENTINLQYNNMLLISVYHLGINPILSSNDIDADFLIDCNVNNGEIITYNRNISGLSSINSINTNRTFNMSQISIKNQNNELFENNNSNIILLFSYY